MNGTNEVAAAGASVLGFAPSDFPQLTLLVVLFAGGLLGGIAGHFMANTKEESVPWYASLLTGVVAAFITPLLLSMISSNLLTEWQTKPHLLFVIAGLALLAAVFSRRFLTSVYDKFMQQVDKLETRIEGVEEANEPPPPELEAGAKAPTANLTAENLTDDHFRIMEAMTNTKYQSRSLSGLRRGAGLSAAVVNQRLTELMTRGFVSQHQTKDNEPRWFLTGPGREALAKVKA
jgi:hypothetical protein